MAYYDEQLQELHQMVTRKRHLEVVLQELAVQEEKLEEKVSQLKKIKTEEETEVEMLGGRSLAAFFYGLIGKKEEKLDKERAEAYAAAVKYDAAVRELAAVEQDIQKGEVELDRLQGSETRYEKLLEGKAASIKETEKLEAGKILELEEKISYLDNQKKELEEAFVVGKKAKKISNEILKSLDSAEGWGTWDLVGGGIFTDLAKHNYLDEAQAKIEQLQVELRRYKTELADVTISADLKVGIEGFLRFADYFFDGVFADWAVLDRITKSKTQVQETKDQVDAVQKQLTALQQKAAEEQERLKAELEELVLHTVC